MGSWTQGVLSLIGAGVDTATGIGSIVTSAFGVANQNRFYEAQLKLQEQQLAIAQKNLEIYERTATPAGRYQDALSQGFDSFSAAQLAGSGAVRAFGLNTIAPVHAGVIDGIHQTANLQSYRSALRSFQNGVPGMTPPAPPLGRAYRSASTASLSSLSSNATSSSWLSSPASTVSWGSLPGRSSSA